MFCVYCKNKPHFVSKSTKAKETTQQNKKI